MTTVQGDGNGKAGRPAWRIRRLVSALLSSLVPTASQTRGEETEEEAYESRTCSSESELRPEEVAPLRPAPQFTLTDRKDSPPLIDMELDLCLSDSDDDSEDCAIEALEATLDGNSLFRRDRGYRGGPPPDRPLMRKRAFSRGIMEDPYLNSSNLLRHAV